MATTDLGRALASLADLGFTEIEALVYAYLLRNEPGTGYRISHAIGKPTANTYEAVASLERPGAVQVDEGDSRLVRAVPPQELLDALERATRERGAAARETLSALSRDDSDDRVYSLRDREQVLERARAMLRRAREIVLGDLFPGPLDELAQELSVCAHDGAKVLLKTYAPREIEGCRMVLNRRDDHAASDWPGQQLSLVVDADEHLLALFDADMQQVHQAVWSRSTFLSCLQHNHLAMELTVTAYGSARPASASAADEAFADLMDVSLLNHRPAGLQKLQRRFGTRTGSDGGGSDGAGTTSSDHAKGNDR